MRNDTITIDLTFVTETCINCGTIWGLPIGYRDELKKTHRNFYCPNGHSQYYPSETNEEKLRKQLEAERQTAFEMNLQREALQMELTQTKKAHERKLKQMKRRAVAGTCQFCKRTFSNMERHMHTQHADEVEAAHLDTAPAPAKETA